jgi:hypothetical protein
MNPIRTLSLVAAAVALLGTAAAPAQAQVVAVQAPAAPLNVGDMFSVSVVGQGFAQAIVGGGFNLSFNPAVLQLTGPATIAPIWEFVPNGGTVNNGAGTLVDVSFNTFATPRSGGFDIATIGLQVVAAGSSMLTLSTSSLFTFSDVQGNLVTPQFAGAQITAVPEPGAVALMLAGLALLLPVLRRRGER